MNNNKALIKKRKRLLICKVLLLLFALLLFLMPDNVNALPDIDLRVLVTVLGLDSGEQGVSVSAQIIVPEAMSAGGGNTDVAEGEGSNVAEAINHLSLGLGRQAELGQCFMIILGEELAKKGCLAELGYLMSSGKISPGANLLLSRGDSAKEFIKGANRLGGKFGAGLNNFIMYSKEGTHVSTLTLLEFLSDSKGQAQAAYLPCVKMEKKEQEGGSDSGSGGGEQGGGESGGSGGGGSGSNSGPYKIGSIDTVAVFSQGKLVRRLEDTQTKGVVWLDKQSRNGLVQLSDVPPEASDGRPLPALLQHKRVKLRAQFENGKPVVTVKLHAVLQLTDKHLLGGGGKKDEALLRTLKQAFEKQIQDEIQSSVDAGKEAGVDYLQLQTLFHRRDHRQLKRYLAAGHDVLQTVEVRYRIDCRVK